MCFVKMDELKQSGKFPISCKNELILLTFLYNSCIPRAANVRACLLTD